MMAISKDTQYLGHLGFFAEISQDRRLKTGTVPGKPGVEPYVSCLLCYCPVCAVFISGHIYSTKSYYSCY